MLHHLTSRSNFFLPAFHMCISFIMLPPRQAHIITRLACWQSIDDNKFDKTCYYNYAYIYYSYCYNNVIKLLLNVFFYVNTLKMLRTFMLFIKTNFHFRRVYNSTGKSTNNSIRPLINILIFNFVAYCLVINFFFICVLFYFILV